MHACLYEQGTPKEKIEDRALRNEVSFDRADEFDCCDYGAGCGYSGGLGDCDLLSRMVSEGDGYEMVKGSRQFLGGWGGIVLRVGKMGKQGTKALTRN